MTLLLSKKNVLITGAGKNIGKSIAIEMAKQGANIYITDLEEGLLKNTETELNIYPVEIKSYAFDITIPNNIDNFSRIMEREKTNFDILINNVGISDIGKRGNQLDRTRWHRIFNTNLFGPIYLTKKISETMIKKKIQGSILFITSIHQWLICGCASYSASKAAIGMLIKELSMELAAHNIRVNGIAPGYIGSDKNGRSIPHRYTPLNRVSINPSYIGKAAVYLSCDYFSKYTTGSILKIDAGLSLYNHLVRNRWKG
jgi:NAD(P)-dependent dehydrogenase (short-subunit alcohol dehydrogenase family)